MERSARQNELIAFRRSCNLDCFAVTVYDHCHRCGQNTVQCLTHRWKVACQCERDHEHIMREEADAYFAAMYEHNLSEIGCDQIAMGM